MGTDTSYTYACDSFTLTDDLFDIFASCRGGVIVCICGRGPHHVVFLVKFVFLLLRCESLSLVNCSLLSWWCCLKLNQRLFDKCGCMLDWVHLAHITCKVGIFIAFVFLYRRMFERESVSLDLMWHCLLHCRGLHWFLRVTGFITLIRWGDLFDKVGLRPKFSCQKLATLLHELAFSPILDSLE